MEQLLQSTMHEAPSPVTPVNSQEIIKSVQRSEKPAPRGFHRSTFHRSWHETLHFWVKLAVTFRTHSFRFCHRSVASSCKAKFQKLQLLLGSSNSACGVSMHPDPTSVQAGLSQNWPVPPVQSFAMRRAHSSPYSPSPSHSSWYALNPGFTMIVCLRMRAKRT